VSGEGERMAVVLRGAVMARPRAASKPPPSRRPEPKARPTQLGTWGNETQGRSERATRAAQKAHAQRAGLRLLDQIIGGTV
jgi:hypothetical protein